mgnify:CR=1 FL=1
MTKTPAIRLQKCLDPSHVRIRRYNTRKPDIGVGILVFMTESSNGKDNTIEYYGEYIGHGQSKTAFVLDNKDAKFHGKVLKVSKTEDMEPAIFTRASEHNVTTSIYDNCGGVDDATACIYHCWITDFAVPLDDFCRKDGVSKRKCVLAAVKCLLYAAMQGYYLSDCHFYNFGVVLTENATEHRVVIIDAGSRSSAASSFRDYETYELNKGEINIQVMRNVYKACEKEVVLGLSL